MQVQINTDHNIEHHDALTQQVNGVVDAAMGRMADHISRVEVHLSDENSDKKGGNHDIRCVMEARLDGHQPLAVTYQADTVHQAVDGAAHKLTRLLRSTIDRTHEHASRVD